MSAENSVHMRQPAWLFVPGDRPDRYAKAAERSDIVIIDLEDAVAPGDKQTARDALLEASHNLPDYGLDPQRTVIRINAAGTEDRRQDIDLLRRLPFTHIMLPKVESAADCEDMAGYSVIALIETARGVRGLADIVTSPYIIGLFWGAEDLIASLGGDSSRNADGTYRAVAIHARSQVLLAGKAAGLSVLDSIYADIKDLEGLRAEALDAAGSGFSGKVAIHPSHIPVIREAFRPTEDQIIWAEAVVAKAEQTSGAFTYEGAMIDAPLLAHARIIMARAKK